MRSLKTLTFTLLFIGVYAMAWSQTDDGKRLEGLIETASDSLGWTIGGGIGLDLGNILIINPQAGAGQNRFGLGGAIGLFANYRNGRFKWFNNISLNLSVEKIGSGVLPGIDEKVPFRKGIDDLQLGSTAAWAFNETSKWSYAANFWLRTQLLPSYIGVEDGQIYVKEIPEAGPYQTRLVSKFFAPMRMNLGLGVMYEPNEHWNFTFTPLTLDLIYIADQDIANLGVHGTKLDSTLGLFSDYLDNPQNIDMQWTNELAFKIWKNLSLSYTNNLYYDDDVSSTITDFDSPGGIKRDPNGVPITGPRLNYYHQLLLKFTQVISVGNKNKK